MILLSDDLINVNFYINSTRECIMEVNKVIRKSFYVINQVIANDIVKLFWVNILNLLAKNCSGDKLTARNAKFCIDQTL